MYLVGNVARNGSNEEDVARRISLVAGASHSLTKICKSRSICRNTKSAPTKRLYLIPAAVQFRDLNTPRKSEEETKSV